MDREIGDSLIRLQTDHVDIYQMHWPDPKVPLEETAEALDIMKKAGKIRYVGLSNFAQKDMEKMMEYISVDCQQSLYKYAGKKSCNLSWNTFELPDRKRGISNSKEIWTGIFAIQSADAGTSGRKVLRWNDYFQE